MSRKIVIVKKIEIVMGDACDGIEPVDLINDIQGLFDDCGEASVLTMGTSQKTDYLYIESVDDECVYNDGGELDCASGREVILDGSKLTRS